MIADSYTHMGKIREAIEAIYKDRKELGLITQKAIASKLGCSQSFVSEMLSGEKHMNDEVIEAFCDALGVDLAALTQPYERPVDPADLRHATELLRHLYTANHDPGFLNISRSIEDWLKPGKAAPAREAKTKADGSAVAEQVATVVEFPKPVTLTNLDIPQPARFVKVPYYERIPAGDPQQLIFEQSFWIDVLHSSAKPSWFALRVSGDSMLPDYRDGDIILMDHEQEPKEGDIVAALIDGSEATLKTFSHHGDEVILTPMNRKKYRVQRYHASRVTVQGVLLELVRRQPRRRK